MRSRFFEPIKRLPAIAWLSLIPIAIFLYLIVKHRFGLVDDAYIPMVYA
ncbi:hypothetical protein GF373_06565, partial [bacterium]|nr:hypothetical protein [bacterium]